MYCRKCGKEIADDSIFCDCCGEVILDGDYPGVRKHVEDSQIFKSVYYGPDYYKGMNDALNSSSDVKETGLKKLIGRLTRKRNKL